MGKSKVEVSGGMSPTFISQIAKSRAVSTQVTATYEDVKKRLESRASAEYSLEGRRTGKYQYGSKRRAGAWGATWILWPITQTARSNAQWIRAAISTAKNTHRRN